jgi:thioredoxin reductase (NADPH)
MAREWDVVVVGAGVAGLAAAKAAAEAGASVIVIDRMGPGGVLMNLPELHGVAGSPAGMDYASTLLDQAMALGAELAIAEVIGLEPGFTITTDDEPHAAKAVVLAVGLGNGRLGIEGEEAYEGQGLSHCAACDGPLYANQRVVVTGHDRWAVQDALDLAVTAEHVTLVTQDGEPDEQAAILGTRPNAAIWHGRVAALTGKEGLESVTVEQNGQASQLPARAIFVQSGRRAPLGFAGDLRTPGLFLAGDCRPGAEETVAAAEADGARAGAAAAAAFARAR